MKETHIYKAYGLLFSSELLIPELLEAEGTPDVVIKLGIVPDSLSNPVGVGARFQATPQEFLLRLIKIAGFYVTGGNEITVEPWGVDNDLNIRLFLLGSVFGALLQQRGYLVLHGSSIEINGKGVLFTGVSGIGKSTLAAAFQNKGYKVLTDDVSAVKINKDGIPYIMPGFPSLKLWKDAAIRMGADVTGLSPVISNRDKYRIDIEASFYDQPVRLQKIFILGTNDTSNIIVSEIASIGKLESLINNTYRYRFLKGQGVEHLHFQQCSCVTNKTAFYNVFRPQSGFMLDELVAAIEKEIGLSD